MPQPIESFTLPITVKLSDGLSLEIDAEGRAMFELERHMALCLRPSELETLCRFLGGGNGITLANRLQEMGKSAHEREETC